MGLGYAHLRHGDFAQATRVLEPGLALCRAMEFRLALPFVAASLGSAYLWSGRAADAVPLLEEAVEAITAMRMLGLRSWFITFLAEAYLVLGRIAEAREQAEQAVALARAHQQRGWEAWGLKLLGDVHAHEPAEADQAGPSRPGTRTGRRSRSRPSWACARSSPTVTSASASCTRRPSKREQATRASHDRDDDVPRDGHAVLAGAGGSGAERAGVG